MKHFNAVQKQIMRHILLIAFIASFVVTSMAALPHPAQAAQITPPPVPDNIQVPAGNELYFVGHATGTQNYICLPAGDSVAFKLFTPQANLFDEKDKQTQISTHFFSPNPMEGGTIRAAWQHSQDTSTVWGQVMPGHSSADPNYVAPGAISWLLVTVVGKQAGPTGGDALMATTYIQRLTTSGGVAPSAGCTLPENVGNQAFVPYTTDYYFYRTAESK